MASLPPPLSQVALDPRQEAGAGSFARPAATNAAAVAPGSDSDEARRIRRRTLRLRMQKLMTASYAVDAALLLLFHLAGTVPGWVPAAYALTGALACGVFYAVLASAWPDRRADQNLTGLQLPIAAAIQLAFVLVAPQIAFVFLTILFIVFAFAALRLDTREATFAWLAMSVGLAVVLTQVGPAIALPHGNTTEVVLVWLSFTTVFGRYVFLGVYGSRVRVSLRRQKEALAASVRRVEELASRDELTGTLNRRSLMVALERHVAAAREDGQAFCVTLFDLDNFKRINDTHGHLVGDRVLEHFARLTREAMRGTDLLGRFGGEEFLAVLGATPAEHALHLVERVRVSVATSDWSALAPGLTVRVSAGVAGYRAGDTVASLTGRADRALYQAKNTGRDRVILAD